jgi:hypothetical protein
MKIKTQLFNMWAVMESLMYIIINNLKLMKNDY